MKNPIWLLSGFLGNENHWGEFPQILGQKLGYSPSWFPWASIVSAVTSLTEAAQLMGQRAYSEGLRPVLVGYSMGGRLALQCATETPGAFSAIVAISAHPGMTEDLARQTRDQEDQQWAKLLVENPTLFWTQWNQRQGLQDTTQPLPPHLELNEREGWAKLLKNFSTARQCYYPRALQTPRLPILWIAGARDQKFAAFKDQFPPSIETAVLINSGHRVPLDAATDLAQVVAPFIRRSQEIL